MEDADAPAAVWRALAQQVISAALDMRDPALRTSMLSIAASYDAMAKGVEAMAAGRGAASGRQSPGR